MAEARDRSQNTIIEAAKNIAAGIPPTNVQIEESIDKAKEVIEEQQRTCMDAQTGVIAQNLKQILTDTQRLLEEKNRDEKMQRFLLEAKLAAEELARDAKDIKKDLDKAEKKLRPLQEEALEIMQKAKGLLYEIMRSPSFRRALMSAIELFQQVFWDQVQGKGKQLAEGLKADLEKGDTSMSSTREAAKDVGERAKMEAREGNLGSMEGERKKQELQRRFNDILRDISENPDYHRAISDLFDLADKMRGRLERAQGKLQSAAKENVHVTRMWEEGQRIIEEFTGHDRIQNIMDALTDLINFVGDDKRARKFFGDLKKYVLEALEHPQRLSIDKGGAGDAYNTLYEEGRKLFESEDLKKRVNTLIDEIKAMIKTARRDPTAERLAESTRALMRDLTMDPATGKPSVWVLRDNLARSGRSILLPVLLRELEVIPLQGMRGSTKSYDYAIRNLVFSAYDLLPERARFYMDLDVDIDLSDIKRDRFMTYDAPAAETDVNGEIVLRLDGIKTHIRDLQFHYRMKTFPNLEDWGSLDVDTRGDGCRIDVRWRIVSLPGSAPTVVGYRVGCYIDGLDVTIKTAAKHELIDRVMSKLWAGTLKERTEREIERSLANFANRVSLIFNDVFAGRVPSLVPASMAAALPLVSL